jgi:hypothetical protein
MEVCVSCQIVANLFDMRCGHRICTNCNVSETCPVCEKISQLDMAQFRSFLPLIDKSIEDSIVESVAAESQGINSKKEF